MAIDFWSMVNQVACAFPDGDAGPIAKLWVNLEGKLEGNAQVGRKTLFLLYTELVQPGRVG